MTGFELMFLFGYVVAAANSQPLQQENYDYCDGNLKLCIHPEDHTMCRFPVPGPSSRCTPSLQEPLSAIEKKRILFWHNKFRSNVANGSERNKSRKLPTAANMRQLYWDNELEMISARWADQCMSYAEGPETDKCRNTRRFSVSQNVGTRGVNSSTIDKQAPQMVISWYKESKNFEPGLIDQFLPLNEEKAASKQFANIIWAETYALGCARVVFQEKSPGPVQEPHKSDVFTVERLVCNYGPGGNEVGKPIYKRGTPCAECPEGTQCSLVFPGLCALTTSIKPESEGSPESRDMKEDNLVAIEPEGSTGTSGKLAVGLPGPRPRPATSGSPEGSERETEGGSLASGDAYADEDGDAEEPGSRPGLSTPASGAGEGKTRDPAIDDLIHRIEEIMNSPKSSARLLFEAFGKKGASEGRNNEVNYNKNLKRTNGKKIAREVKQSLEEVVVASDGKRCKCVEMITSGGEGFFQKKLSTYFLVAGVILEQLIFRE